MSRGAELRKQEYHVEGFSCMDCATQFGKRVQALPEVEESTVHFGTEKLVVYGKVSLDTLQQVARQEGFTLRATKERASKQSFWKNRTTGRMAVSGILLLAGIVTGLEGLQGLGFPYLPAFLPVFLLLLSIALGGTPLFIRGCRNLSQLRFDMHVLMTVAIVGAVAIGELVEGAVVVFLFAISEALERFSMDKARASIRSLMEEAPTTAIIVRDGQELELRVEEVQIDDRLIIKPGQRIALDGVVVEGASTVNQSTITGESLPVQKGKGDEVFAGTMNEAGYLVVRVTKLSTDSTLAKIIQLVEEAQAQKSPAQALVDRFAAYYTPSIMVIALLIATIPPLFLQGVWEEWVYRGLALLVVGCPCALVISTPVSIVTAMGHAARRGVYVKGGIYLEELASLRAIAFDKTGTLTEGRPKLVDILPLHGSERDVLGLAATLEACSEHPLAAAVVQRAKEEQVVFSGENVVDFRAVTGRGIEGTIEGQLWRLGAVEWMEEVGWTIQDQELLSKITARQEQGETVIVLATEGSIYGLLCITDPIRPASRRTLEALHQLGMKETLMLSGDHQRTAQAVGKQVGVRTIQGELLPHEKAALIREKQAVYGKLAMVGDGVNDAPALATANVGIAMGERGADCTLETADAVLMADDLEQLPFLIKLSRKTLRIIKQNIVLAFGLKLIALALILPGWLTLWLAILADMGATLLVIANGLRLLRKL